MNSNALLAEIILKGKNIPSVAKELNIAKTTLYKKVRGMSAFTVPELEELMVILNLDKASVFKNFFNDLVS